MVHLAETRAELAETHKPLDAEVGFKEFSVHVFGNFLRIVLGNFLGIFCHFLSFFNGTFNVSISPQVREKVNREMRRRQQDKKPPPAGQAQEHATSTRRSRLHARCVPGLRLRRPYLV